MRGGKRREGEGRRREGRERGWGLSARPAPSVPTPASAPSRAAASPRCPASPPQPPLAVCLCRCCHHLCRHSWRGAGPAEPRREPPRVGRALQVSHWAGAGGACTGLGRCVGRWEPLAGNRGNPVRTPPAFSRGPQEPSELPPQSLPHRTDPVCIPTWMPPDSLCIRTRILRIPSVSHPDPSEPLSISAASPRPSLQSHPSPDPSPASSPWLPPGPGRQVAALEQGRWTRSQSRLGLDRPCALGPPGACPFGPRLPARSVPVPLAGLPAPA